MFVFFFPLKLGDDYEIVCCIDVLYILLMFYKYVFNYLKFNKTQFLRIACRESTTTKFWV